MAYIFFQVRMISPHISLIYVSRKPLYQPNFLGVVLLEHPHKWVKYDYNHAHLPYNG